MTLIDLRLGRFALLVEKHQLNHARLVGCEKVGHGEIALDCGKISCHLSCGEPTGAPKCRPCVRAFKAAATAAAFLIILHAGAEARGWTLEQLDYSSSGEPSGPH